MKVNELMIYNWVLYNGNPNIVTGIIPPSPTEDKRWDGKWVIEINPPDIFNVTLDELEPIPLTEEWLLKFGLKKEKVSGYSGADMWAGMGAYSYNGEWLFRGNSSTLHLVGYINTNIIYVHQLQNLLFSLFGKELTIKQN